MLKSFDVENKFSGADQVHFAKREYLPTSNMTTRCFPETLASCSAMH